MSKFDDIKKNINKSYNYNINEIIDAYLKSQKDYIIKVKEETAKINRKFYIEDLQLSFNSINFYNEIILFDFNFVRNFI